ncbi:MAG: hypothetical protein ACRD11_09945, partial [Terriglobia bacterium]
MPTIELTDQFGLNLHVNPDPASAIAKYLNPALALPVVLANAAAMQNITLKECPPALQSIGFSLGNPEGITIRGTAFTVVAGAAGGIEVTSEGALFDPDPYGDPIPVPAGRCYVSLSIRAAVNADVEAPAGTFAFGFSAGGEAVFSNSRLFSAAGRLDAAVAEMLRRFVIPGEFDDLTSLGNGDVARVHGSGSLQFSATVNLLTLVNPLAAVPSAILAAPLELEDGGSVAATASVKLTGDYEIRIDKVESQTLRLGYYKKHGSDFGIQVNAQLGLSAEMNNADAIAGFLRAMSGAGAPDADALTAAGLTDAQGAAVTAAIHAAIE